MKGFIVVLMFLFLLGAAPADAANKPESIKVQVNREKRSPRSNLSIRFVELIEDSRCPTDTNCIWAGNGKIRVSIKRGNRPAKVFEMDTNGPNKTVTHSGYRITLSDLTPHPASNIRINRNGYVATLQIEKS